MHPHGPSPRLSRILSILALLFGLITLAKSGSIIFGPVGPDSARAAAGNFVPFVLYFNFVAGVFYVLAGVGLWFRRRWAFWVSVLIAVTTIFTTAAFALHVWGGGMYEMQTVGALPFRVVFWVGIILILHRARR